MLLLVSKLIPYFQGWWILETSFYQILRLYPDWVTCTIALPNEASTLLGVTAGGTLKVWRLALQSNESVFWEEESKQIADCLHPIQVALDLTSRNVSKFLVTI